MTRKAYLVFGIVFGSLVLGTGYYFYTELVRIPDRLTDANTKMLQTDSLRHIYKVSLLAGRAYEAYLVFLETGAERERQISINLGKAAIGFASSALSDDKTLAPAVVPLIAENLSIVEGASGRNDAARGLTTYKENMREIYREIQSIEQTIWVSFQRDFVRFQANEHRAAMAYQFGAALAVGILMIVVFFFLRQRSLLRTIEMREVDLEEMIELRNKELVLLRETQAAAQAGDRAKTEFLALMSHELRTPLNAIVGFSEIVKSADQKWASVDKTTEYAEAIHSAGLHLLKVINDILDLAKIEAGETDLKEAEVSLPAIAQRSVDLMRLRLREKRLAVKIDMDPGLPGLIADERLIYQILINLLSNAVKFTDQDGEIAVFANVVADGSLDVGVRDTGTGIAEADLNKVMQPFAQLRRDSSVAHEGTGLGLPLTRRFAELHGATVSLESTLNVGTVVTVRFPANRVSDRVPSPS